MTEEEWREKGAKRFLAHPYSPIVSAYADGALAAQQDGVREVLDEALVTLSHARLFVTSRQKMHPDGVKLYDELIDRLKGLEQERRDA